MSACSTHCCPAHGCKYSKPGCPVALGEELPTYPFNNGCEQCESDIEDLEFEEHHLIVCCRSRGCAFEDPECPVFAEPECPCEACAAEPARSRGSILGRLRGFGHSRRPVETSA